MTKISRRDLLIASGTAAGAALLPSSASYFYTCDVVFDLFDTSAQTKSLKGWVELVR